MQIIDILLIDDEKDYCREVKNQLRSIGIDEGYDVITNDFQNLEDGFAELEKDSKYKALILDAKAFVTPEQETINFDFIVEALSRLEESNRKTGRIHIPFAVNTGYSDGEVVKAVKTRIESQKGKLFDKSRQAEEMLKYLLKEIVSTENTKIEKQYKDVFEIFRDDKMYLNLSYRADLLEILKKLDNPSRLKDNFNPLRKFLEPVYKAIKAKHTNLIPDIVFYNRNGADLNLDWIQRYLTGQKVTIPPPPNRNGIDYQTNAKIPFHAGWGIKYLEELGSKISHDYPESISISAYKSAVFALLEVLLWFKKLMDNP